MSETTAVTTEGSGNGTQEKSAPETTEAKAPLSPEAKIAEDKAAADAKLLDGNGNPKSEEVLAEEKETEAKTGETDTNETTQVEELGEKVKERAKQVEDLITSAGVDPEVLLSNADVATGNISVDHKAKLVEKHGEAIADLIEGNIQKMMADVREIASTKNNAVFSQVAEAFKGTTEQTGQESWKELAGWVKENVDKDTRREYNNMLDAGGIQASLAVKEMVTKFKESNDMTIPAQLVEGDGDSVVTPSGFITRQEYNTQLEKLRDAGHDYDTSPEIAALNNRRTKSIAMGK